MRSARRDPGSNMTSSSVWTSGTFRSCLPEHTWERIQPVMAEAGITRVADLTHLDRSGISVHTAVRPAAKTLIMSQGKGVTSMLSRISAAMESLELWRAELRPAVAMTNLASAELRHVLGYSVLDLDVPKGTLLSDRTHLDWVSCRTISEARKTFIPLDCVYLDRSVGDAWLPPYFVKSSNGLASGNDQWEAALHAICEVVERDSIGAASPNVTSRPVRLSDLQSSLLDSVVAQIESVADSVGLFNLTGRFGVPCFAATVGGYGVSKQRFAGFGCHPDSAVAALRAVTEAVQNRVALIAGSRDDLAVWRYDHLARVGALGNVERPPPDPSFEPIKFSCDLHDEVLKISARMSQVAGSEPMLVNLTSGDYPIQVVRVVVPRVRYHDMSGLR